MPIKGLEKGDGVWGRGKEPFLKRFFPLPQGFPINLYREQCVKSKVENGKKSGFEPPDTAGICRFDR